jgi:thiol-disulfide isomerase/thioredoxin
MFDVKLFLKSALWAVLLTVALVPLRFAEIGLGIDGTTLLGFAVFFGLTLYRLKIGSLQNDEILSLSGILVGELVLFPHTIYHFFDGHLFFLPQLIFQTLAILCAYLFWKIKIWIRFLPPVLGWFAVILMFTNGFTYWFHYLNYGTFTGQITTYSDTVPIEGVNSENAFIHESTFHNKIVLLDFWNTSCGACFEKFPKLEAFYKGSKDDDSVVIFAVDKPLQEDKPESAVSAIRDRGYTFPVLIPSDEDLPEKFAVSVYPTTIVIDASNKVVFKGSIEGAVATVQKLKEL